MGSFYHLLTRAQLCITLVGRLPRQVHHEKSTPQWLPACLETKPTPPMRSQRLIKTPLWGRKDRHWLLGLVQ